MRGWRETEREFRRERDRRVKPTLPKLKFMEGERREEDDQCHSLLSATESNSTEGS